MALINAGIPMKDFVCASSAGYIEDTPLLGQSVCVRVCVRVRVHACVRVCVLCMSTCVCTLTHTHTQSL